MVNGGMEMTGLENDLMKILRDIKRTEIQIESAEKSLNRLNEELQTLNTAKDSVLKEFLKEFKEYKVNEEEGNNGK